MNARRIILAILGLLVVVGIVNFVVGNVQDRAQLALVQSKETSKQEEGVRRLMERGKLFDVLQGAGNKETRLAAVATLKRMAEGGKDPKAFNELLQMLKDPDTESVETKTHPVRDAARDAVAAVGLQYQEALFTAAKNPDGNIRDQSREALKKIGRPLKEEMAKRLGDGDLRGAMGDMLSAIGPETVPLIAPYLAPPLLKADDSGYKIQLIEILGKFTVPEAATPILPFKDDKDPNVRRATVTSLANIAQPVGASVLIAALNNPASDASARAAAAGALGGIATPEANAAMQKAVSDYDVVVATAATAGLRRAGDKAASNIAQLLTNADAAVRARGAEAAGGLRQTTLATKALSDTDASVRAQAVESLGDILAQANSVRTALTTLATSTDATAQEKALDALQIRNAFGELNAPGQATAKAKAIAFLTTRTKETDDAKSKAATERIAQLNAAPVPPTPLADSSSSAALAPLLAALRDTDGRVSQNAVTALSRLGTPAVKPLLALLASPDETVAYLASQALVAVGRPAVPELLPAAQVGKQGARWAAVTLGEIGDAQAASALQSLSQSPDPDTAYAAQTALAKVGGKT